MHDGRPVVADFGIALAVIYVRAGDIFARRTSGDTA